MRKLLLIVFMWHMLEQSYASSSILQYFKDYNMGVNFIKTHDSIRVSYGLVDEKTWGSNCAYDKNNSEVRCNVSVGQNSGGFLSDTFGGFGIFFQQPFKRTGFFHLTADVGFGLLAYQGKFKAKDGEQNGLNHQLHQLSYGLYGLRMKPYLQFGLTPEKNFPDILVSIGPVFQAYGGQTSINNKSKKIFVAQGSEFFSGVNPLNYAYFELELVFYRFGEGAFSLYFARAAETSRYDSGEFYPGEIDGMKDFDVALASQEIGLKLLLNWPR